MNIDTLQLKRVTGNWEKHKSTVPAQGEAVLLNMDEEVTFGRDISGTGEWVTNTKFYPILVIGDGNTTLENLLHPLSSKMFLSNAHMRTIIASMTGHDVEPQKIEEKATNPEGKMTFAARADHSHILEKSAAEGILKTNEELSQFNCRRISAGTNDPVKGNVGGSVGDIYIQYVK